MATSRGPSHQEIDTVSRARIEDDWYRSQKQRVVGLNAHRRSALTARPSAIIQSLFAVSPFRVFAFVFRLLLAVVVAAVAVVVAVSKIIQLSTTPPPPHDPQAPSRRGVPHMLNGDDGPDRVRDRRRDCATSWSVRHGDRSTGDRDSCAARSGDDAHDRVRAPCRGRVRAPSLWPPERRRSRPVCACVRPIARDVPPL